MKSLLYMPKQINVGYQKRSGTYTGKLAYIIYFDEKGKLRKETSWNSWREQNLGNDIFENEPTEGFVLNKKVGDYSGYWGEHRSAYVRVYDSERDFEFEITVENLLYILENCTSTKGKGLEGKFVYAWDGKNLILLPVDSPDYKDIKEYTDLLNSNFKLGAKTIKVGATYVDKSGAEYVYMGKFPYYKYDYGDENKIEMKNKETEYKYYKHKTKHYYFRIVGDYSRFDITTSLAKFITVKDEECHPDYADFYGELEERASFSPPDYSTETYEDYSQEEFISMCKKVWDEYDYKTIYFTDGVNWHKTSVELEKWKEEYKGWYKVRMYKWTTNRWYSEPRWEGYFEYYETLEEVFENHKPCILKIKLENGKPYKG